MSLLDPLLASTFLLQYKRLLGDMSKKRPKCNKDFIDPRRALYGDGLNTRYAFDSSYENSFIDAVRRAIHGTFIYAKKYRQGYALKSPDNGWLFVKGLTTPMEEMIPDWVVIDTAVLPYCDQIVCDGLIVNRQTFIGPNMVKSMTRELNTARKKRASP